MTIKQMIDNLQAIADQFGSEMEIAFCTKICTDHDELSYTENYSENVEFMVNVPMNWNDKEPQRLIINTYSGG